MSRKARIIFKSGSSKIYQNQAPFLHQPSLSPSGRIAEVAGGTTAECAAVWCCFPFSVVNLLILAVYKVPVGLCRKAIRRRRKRRLIKKGLFPIPPSSSSSAFSSEYSGSGSGSSSFGGSPHDWEWDPTEEIALILVGEGGTDHELEKLEKDMWDRFYSAGFWRSPSQRHT